MVWELDDPTIREVIAERWRVIYRVGPRVVTVRSRTASETGHGILAASGNPYSTSLTAPFFGAIPAQHMLAGDTGPAIRCGTRRVWRMARRR
jgi:hypothetical protein